MARLTARVRSHTMSSATNASGRTTDTAAPSTQWWALASGLVDGEVTRRREQYGSNERDQEQHEPCWRAFLRQYRDLLQLVLLGASIVALLIGELSTAAVVFAITLFNAFLALSQESKAERQERVEQRDGEHDGGGRQLTDEQGHDRGAEQHELQQVPVLAQERAPARLVLLLVEFVGPVLLSAARHLAVDEAGRQCPPLRGWGSSVSCSARGVGGGGHGVRSDPGRQPGHLQSVITGRGVKVEMVSAKAASGCRARGYRTQAIDGNRRWNQPWMLNAPGPTVAMPRNATISMMWLLLTGLFGGHTSPARNRNAMRKAAPIAAIRVPMPSISATPPRSRAAMNATSATLIEVGADGAIHSNRKPVWLASVPNLRNP